MVVTHLCQIFVWLKTTVQLFWRARHLIKKEFSLNFMWFQITYKVLFTLPSASVPTTGLRRCVKGKDEPDREWLHRAAQPGEKIDVETRSLRRLLCYCMFKCKGRNNDIFHQTRAQTRGPDDQKYNFLKLP